MDENRAPDTYYVYVTSTGQVIDGRPFHIISSCKLDIYTFPFDFQNCTYTFNSYKHSRDDVQLFFYKPVKDIFKESLDLMTTKGEWELIDMLAEKPVYSFLEGAWDNLIVHIVLRRRATLYVVNLLIPSSFLLSLDIFSFLLPPQTVDRASFKMTLILGYTVFLLLMNDLLPVTGNNLPLINLDVFFSMCLALMVASLLETIVITNVLCGSRNFPPLPKWLKILVLKYMARLVCMRKSSDKHSEGKTPFGSQDLDELSSYHWCETYFPMVVLSPFFTANRSEPTLYKNMMTNVPKKEQVSASPVTLSDLYLEEMKKISTDLLAIRHHIEEHFDNDSSSDEWMVFAQVLDRLFFMLYMIFVVVSLSTIMFLWLHSYNLDKRS
nr:5-hydroxytryptamine receptor 3A-like [Danio rerio]|eukprot:XP_021325143.1 5-hydroxytryptamine receptor 3A-like [Danio rerio]